MSAVEVPECWRLRTAARRLYLTAAAVSDLERNAFPDTPTEEAGRGTDRRALGRLRKDLASHLVLVSDDAEKFTRLLNQLNAAMTAIKKLTPTP